MARMSFPPGFRFHPTDVELVKYYLKRKSLGKRIPIDPIAEVNVCQYSPWDLPDKSCLKNKDLEWYFFCPVARKYASGARSNRATETGYWKSTGKDRPVTYNDETAGMIKTLIFHQGKPPKGDRTDWVIHEYRILDKELAGSGVDQAPYVLVKLFKKSGLGPRNGAQYGAPFKEEEYDIDDEDEVGMFPETLQPNLPLSVVPNNNSVATNTFFHGSTSATSLSPSNNSPLSTVTHNNSYSVATTSLPPSNNSPLSTVTHNNSNSVAIPTQPEHIPPTVLPFECNSVHTNSFFQGSTSTTSVQPSENRHLPTMTHNSNSVIDTSFQGGTPTGPLPVPDPSAHISFANYGTLPVGERVDLAELLAMFEQEEPPVLPSDSNTVNQVNGEEFLELDDIYNGLDDLTDWDDLSRVFK